MQQSSNIKWSSLAIGVIFLIIGVFIISFPEENLFTITWLIGLLFIINGFLEIFVRQVIKNATQQRSTLLILLGIINIILGLLLTQFSIFLM
ncbi:DUF308 domain-containing protein [Staphylococcus shinii]|uniref:DUF308 domain-containing protein n=1 Tax=Staphylococcus shinii TaxID=2912228 RepID=UPI0021756000|nr:DUF308 domain-containing protein [Staphylococcus shinii]MDW8564951.1 DUF308 domain-containing protein [Staphylococcus shinii]